MYVCIYSSEGVPLGDTFHVYEIALQCLELGLFIGVRGVFAYFTNFKFTFQRVIQLLVLYCIVLMLYQLSYEACLGAGQEGVQFVPVM